MEFKDESILEYFEKTIKQFGTSAHIILPKRLVGKKVKILVMDDRFFK
jgi:putative transposon-encoded protein